MFISIIILKENVQLRRKKKHTQSLSNIMTVSADVKFKPSPPARVDMSIKKQSGSVLKNCIASTLYLMPMVPSSLVNL